MSTLTTTVPTTGTATWSPTKVIVAATVFGIVLNTVLEGIEAVILPEARGNLLSNVLIVVLYSAVGCALTLGLVMTGRGRTRPAVAILLAIVALLTVMPLFWCAVPGTLAAGGWALAHPVEGTPSRIAWLLSILAFVSFVAVSVGMLLVAM